MQNKALSFLGLCQRAGKLASGEQTCEKAVRDGKAKLLIIAEDASPNTCKKFQNMASFYHVEIRAAGTKEELGRAVGKVERAVFVVLEDGFSEKLKELLMD